MSMKLSLALASQVAGWACLVAAGPPARAAEVLPAAAAQVVITGSAIKRVAAEGPVPVQIIRRAEIAATGATSTSELLKSIASIDIFDQGEMDSGSPAGSGTSFVRMRGLDETEVLVLLNGRRLPTNPLYDTSGLGGAVNINMIPLSAIERIEILKDGGSALYGADAVAGVVNFITRKDYQGAEAALGFGTSSRHDGTEKQLNVTGGFGDLAADGYNFLATFEHFRRDPIFRKDRELSRTTDYRRYGGGDYRSVFSPYGNLLDANGNLSGATVRPCPAGLFNEVCRYDFNADLLTAYNAADRSAAMVVGNVRLGTGLTGTVQLLHSESRDRFEMHPVPDFFVLPSGDNYTGRFMQGGPRITDRRAAMDGINLGLEGRRDGLDWDLTTGYSRARVTNDGRNHYDANLWSTAVNSGALDATTDTNDPALVDSLKVRYRREGTAELGFLDGKLSGELARLAHGPVAYALGFSLWRETLVDTPDALTQQDQVIGQIQQSAVDASRNARALFAELNVPLAASLEAQLAARLDRYPTASRTSPKAALKWRPAGHFMLRGSYAESFQMPRLRQLYGSRDQGAISLGSPEECAAIGQPTGCLRPAWQVTGGNAALRPEQGRTWNLGAAVDLGPFSGTIDWWRLRLKDAIDRPDILEALHEGRTATTSGGELFIFTNVQNFAVKQSSGIDLDGRLRLAGLPGGTLTLRNTTTHYLDIRRQRGVNTEWEHLLGSYAQPRLRNVLSISHATPAWLLTATHKFVGGFRDTSLTATGSTPLPADTRRVASHSEVDVAAAYRGWRQLTITAGVKNLFDREPPLSLHNASSADTTQLGYAELYSNRGRFFHLTAEVRFR